MFYTSVSMGEERRHGSLHDCQLGVLSHFLFRFPLGGANLLGLWETWQAVSHI